MLAVDGSVYGHARPEDGPEMLVRDQALLEEVLCFFDGVGELLVDEVDEKLVMLLRFIALERLAGLLEFVFVVEEDSVGCIDGDVLCLEVDAWEVADCCLQDVLQVLRIDLPCIRLCHTMPDRETCYSPASSSSAHTNYSDPYTSQDT